MPARRLTDSPVVRSGAVGASGRSARAAGRGSERPAGPHHWRAGCLAPRHGVAIQSGGVATSGPLRCTRRRLSGAVGARRGVARQPAAVEEHPLGVERGEADDSRLRSLPVGGQEGVGRSCGSGRSRPDRRGSGAPRFRNDASIWRWHASPRSPPVLVVRSGRSRRYRPVRLARSIVGVHDRTPVMHQRA